MSPNQIPEETPPPKQPSKRKPSANIALRYSGMAIQLAVLLAIGTFAGSKMDAYFETERPYFTAIFALLALFAGFYLVLKDLFVTDSKKDHHSDHKDSD